MKKTIWPDFRNHLKNLIKLTYFVFHRKMMIWMDQIWPTKKYLKWWTKFKFYVALLLRLITDYWIVFECNSVHNLQHCFSTFLSSRHTILVKYILRHTWVLIKLKIVLVLGTLYDILRFGGTLEQTARHTGWEPLIFSLWTSIK